MDKYAEIVLSKATPRTDRIYHYSIPQKLKGALSIGSQVLVPFGNRKDIGYVVGFTKESEVKKVKDILSITSERPLFNESSVALARWLSEYYLSFFIKSLRTVMPPGTQRKEKSRRKNPERKRKSAKKSKKTPEAIVIEKPLAPNEHQQKALNLIIPQIENEASVTILLFGITGSGKTEVYMQAAAHALRLGKSAMILVPEVALTSHLIERFELRFRDHLAVFHSDMPEMTRRENWMKVSSGVSRIILGTRSALFAPAKKIGLIVIDEEYENSYKQDQNPRYNTRDAAKFIAERTGATIILGSATPSIETFYKAKTGEYLMAELPERIDGKKLPPSDIIDMRSEGNRKGVLSKKLREKIKETLSAGQQVILFINRRGYFTFALCRDCGHAINCPHCAVPLIFHMSDRKMKCNRCSFSAPSTLICPQCQSSSIGFLGTGTQRIEEEVSAACPSAKIVRIDRDTVKKRGSINVLFSAFKEGGANVLIGTQLVTKGLDVARVTLVGVVSADTGLNLPDFRSGEHIFQLLTQVAGRAGRHNLPGQVMIQTLNPEHYAIRCAACHDYRGFYDQEITTRRELGYPPFNSLINIILYGPNEKNVRDVAENLGSMLLKRLDQKEQLLGPSEAMFKKLRGNFRWQLVLKGPDISSIRKKLVDCMRKVVLLSNVRVSVDIDPLNML